MFEFQNETEYSEALRKLEANEQAKEAWFIADGQNPKGWRSMPIEVSNLMPYANEVTNDLRSAIEVYEFKRDKPERYFLYIRDETKEAITWIGQKLGSVSFGNAYRDNFGGKRIPITVFGINGIRYFGTYYTSSGNYARIKAAKNQ